MKLWQKDKTSLNEVHAFTVGNDRDFDLMLAPFDVLGSIAHVTMLEAVGLLNTDEKTKLVKELQAIYQTTSPTHHSPLTIHPESEDIHTQVEFLLTQKLGDTGKKIHTARSRNDQVLVDTRLFIRQEMAEIVAGVNEFFHLLQSQSERFRDHLMPGYTHLQLAMPSSFGLWFGAYAESLVDDMITLKAAFDVVNKNPLGSGAGYGSSFPINRSMTTELLGFAELNYNVVYAQMGRGKVERITAMALANIADTLSRLSMDACLYLNQNFGFISFPDELTTGSSIMPHKKNPDVFELIRSHCNRIKALPNEIMIMTTNLPSGYHRDLQLLKEHLFPAFKNLKNCLAMAGLMLSNIEIRKDILKDEKYKFLFTVDAVNQLVMQGIPFRDAYKKIGQQVEEGTYSVPKDIIAHTHEGSMGNLNNEQIKMQMEKLVDSFPFEYISEKLNTLIQ